MRSTRICDQHGWHRAGIPPSSQRRRARRLTDSSVRRALTRTGELIAAEDVAAGLLECDVDSRKYQIVRFG